MMHDSMNQIKVASIRSQDMFRLVSVHRTPFHLRHLAMLYFQAGGPIAHLFALTISPHRVMQRTCCS